MEKGQVELPAELRVWERFSAWVGMVLELGRAPSVTRVGGAPSEEEERQPQGRLEEELVVPLESEVP
jgi:hypothetical protein